jgi:hypothetical protein
VKKLSLMSTRRNKRDARALGRAAVVVLLFGIDVAIWTTGHAAADFSGAWVVTKYSPELKTSEGKSPPLLPKADSLYSQRKALRAKGDESFDIVASHCGPPGLPRVMMLPYAFEVVQNPKKLVFLFEWNRLYRRVDIDGPSMNADDLQFTGRAVGHWDSDTLVVETTSIDDTLLDAAGMPHSAELKITERLRLLKDGTLEDRMRFEDSKTFRAPWDTVVSYRKLPKGTEVREDVCLDRIKTTRAIDEKKYLSYPK